MDGSLSASVIISDLKVFHYYNILIILPNTMTQRTIGMFSMGLMHKGHLSGGGGGEEEAVVIRVTSLGGCGHNGHLSRGL